MATDPILRSSRTNSTYNINTKQVSNPDTPVGWDAVTYNNFKAANPNLEPNAQDTSMMLNAGAVSQSNIPSVVPVTGLSSTPVNLMPTQVPTAAVGGIAALGGQALSVQDQFMQQQNALLQQQQGQVTQQQNGLTDVYNRIFGQADRNEDIYKDLKVDEAQQAVNNYTSQIEQEQLANRRQIEELQKNATGMTAQALSATSQEVNRKSLSAQADLAVLQGAAARNFDAVASAADRKIQAETESLQMELDARKFFYQENKDDYNKTEQRLYEQQNRKIEQEIKNKEDSYKVIVDAVAQGAPASLIQEAQALYNQGADPVQIVQKLGRYSTNYVEAQIKKEQLNALRTPSSSGGSGGGTSNIPVAIISEVQNNPAYANVPPESIKLVSLLNQYNKILNDTSALSLAVNKDKKKSTLNSIEGLITAEYKQAKKLGTLDAGVQTLIDKLLGKGEEIFGIAVPKSNKSRSAAVSNWLLSEGYDASKEIDTTQLKAKLKEGEILVRNQQGVIGAIPVGEFNPKTYTKL